jgi:hypothetical protein
MKEDIAVDGKGWYNNILHFGMHCIAGSCSLAVIVLLFDDLNRYNAWQSGYYANVGSGRSLKSERWDSYGNGEEICKGKHVDAVFIG